MALGPLGFVGKLIVVGFGMAKNTYSISRLMAFDGKSSAHGDASPSTTLEFS